MPTLRLQLFDRDFDVLDRTDIPVPGDAQPGAGQAVKAAKQHFWENHFAPDLDTLMASRQNLLERLDDLLGEVEKAQAIAKLAKEGGRFRSLRQPEREGHVALADTQVKPNDLIDRLLSLNLTECKSAVMESKMINDTTLPKKYKEELEAKHGRRRDEMGAKR